MQLSANSSARLALFACLAVSSLALKAAAGPPRDNAVGAAVGVFEPKVSHLLRGHDFSVTVRTFAYRSALILGVRGKCRIGVRNAMQGSAMVSAFAQDARSIGPVSYFYRGARYSSPPEFRVRIGRLEAEMLNRVGLRRETPVLVAFAVSSECGQSTFGVTDVRLPAS